MLNVYSHHAYLISFRRLSHDLSTIDKIPSFVILLIEVYMAIVTVNISLPDTMKADVEEIMSAEGYGNTSEFFRDLVRDYQRRRAETKLEALLLERLEKNEEVEFDIQQVKAELTKRLAKRS